MPLFKKPESVKPNKHYVLDINEKTINDLNRVPLKQRKAVARIIKDKEFKRNAPKKYIVNGVEVLNPSNKIKGLAKKIIEKNPDIAYETRLDIYQLSNVKSIFVAAIFLGVLCSLFYNSIYIVFSPAYKLPNLPIIFTILVGIISGIASYELALKQKEEHLEEVFLRGIVLDPDKEYKRQKELFALAVLGYIPIFTLILIFVECATILSIS